MIEVGVATMGLPFAEVARWASQNGVRWIEAMVGPVFGGGGRAGPDLLDLETVPRDGPGRVQEMLAGYGVGLSALAPMLNLLDADPEVRRERAQTLRQTIDACALLGVPTAVVYGGSSTGMFFHGLPAVGPHHPSNTTEDNLRLFEAVITPLAAYAEQKGVRIAMETAPRGGGHGNLAHSPEMWERLFSAVPSGALGLSFDPSHLVWLQVGPVDSVIRRFGSRIYHVDGKDTEIMRDRLAVQGILGNSWWRYRIPGMGELDWRTIIAALTDVGYSGPIDIENEDPLFPGLPGCTVAARHLAALLPPSAAQEGSQ